MTREVRLSGLNALQMLDTSSRHAQMQEKSKAERLATFLRCRQAYNHQSGWSFAQSIHPYQVMLFHGPPHISHPSKRQPTAPQLFRTQLPSERQQRNASARHKQE